MVFKDIIVHCAYCAVVLPGANYTEHLKLEHQDKVLTTWKKCELCKELLPNYFKVEIHNLLCHFPTRIQCAVCPFTFTSFLVYMRHFNNDHEDYRMQDVFYCKLCKPNSTCFGSKTMLRIHMHQKHAKFVQDNWHLCAFCVDER